MLIILLAIAILLALGHRRPAPVELLVTIEPVEPASGCGPALLIALTVLITLALMKS